MVHEPAVLWGFSRWAQNLLFLDVPRRSGPLAEVDIRMDVQGLADSIATLALPADIALATPRAEPTVGLVLPVVAPPPAVCQRRRKGHQRKDHGQGGLHRKGRPLVARWPGGWLRVRTSGDACNEK